MKQTCLLYPCFTQLCVYINMDSSLFIVLCHDPILSSIYYPKNSWFWPFLVPSVGSDSYNRHINFGGIFLFLTLVNSPYNPIVFCVQWSLFILFKNDSQRLKSECELLSKSSFKSNDIRKYNKITPWTKEKQAKSNKTIDYIFSKNNSHLILVWWDIPMVPYCSQYSEGRDSSSRRNSNFRIQG